MKKFWTIRDGVIGTAHMSRDGRVVDFRASMLPRETTKYVDCVGYPAIVVAPAVGVEAEELLLVATVDARGGWYHYADGGKELRPVDLAATFTCEVTGAVVPIVVASTESRTTDATRAAWRLRCERYAREDEAKVAAARARIDASKAALAELMAMTGAELLASTGVTRQERSRLTRRTGRWERVARDVLTRADVPRDSWDVLFPRLRAAALAS